MRETARYDVPQRLLLRNLVEVIPKRGLKMLEPGHLTAREGFGRTDVALYSLQEGAFAADVAHQFAVAEALQRRKRGRIAVVEQPLDLLGISARELLFDAAFDIPVKIGAKPRKADI